MYIGQADMVKDIIKLVIGFIGGMGYSAYRQSKKSDPD